MILLKPKKAQFAAGTAVFWIAGLVLTIAFITGFLYFTGYYSSSKVNIEPKLEEYILYQRFLSSPDCFVYEDISGRAYPLVIDWNKFTQKNIDSCYIPPSQEISPAFRLKLSFQDKEKTAKTRNWDDSLGFARITPKKILVYYNNQKQLGELSIEIQNE
ncbi:hypothetical protein KY332_03190 [Candidatus Woesearchaeota archaeon]|nr:hypothetical protein [Candidatus Woesearchaeota archaeon]